MNSAENTPAKADKWERVRRLRYGDFLRLFRDRWGYELPNDDAGRGDLKLLLFNISFARKDPQERMLCAIDIWAPWMSAEERDHYVKFVWGLDFYERLMTGREIGEELGLTNAERDRLKLWQFKPIDMTAEELAEHRRRKNNERRRAKRGRTRAEYLASCLSASKPWEAEGISRSQWHRRHATTRGRNKHFKAESILVASSVVESQKGIHGGSAVLRLSEAKKAKAAETNAPSSHALRHNLSHEQVEQNVTDPRLQLGRELKADT